MIREVLKNKDLILYSVKGDLKTQVSRLMLGYFWWLLDPIMYMAVYTILVDVIFQRGNVDYPAFVFCALVPWKWTVTSISDCVNSISGRASLINQIKVDSSVFPVIKILSNFFKFCFGLITLFIVIMFFDATVSWAWLYIIPLVLVHFIFNLGIGLVLANLGVFYKDINNILQFSLRLWFYLSPGLWSISRFPAKYEKFLWINPMTSFFTSYREILLNGNKPLLTYILFWGVISVLLVWYGWRKIKRNEGNYPRVV